MSALFSHVSSDAAVLPTGRRAVPDSVAALVWRGDAMGGRAAPVMSSGHAVLDAQLPGGGWPCQALTELLIDHSGACEWRLLGPVLRRVQAQGDTVFLIGAPHTPHMRGLRAMGLNERQIVWVQADSVRDRLWAAAQVIQSGQAGAVMSWLPQVDTRALRRLQAVTSHCDAPVFVLRPSQVAHDTSPAPLRLSVAPGVEPWQLKLHIVKRRGPVHEEAIEVASMPAGMAAIVATRMAAKIAAQLHEHEKAKEAARPVAMAPDEPPLTIEERTHAVLAGAAKSSAEALAH